MKRIALVLIVYLGYAFHLTAQVPDSTPPPAGNKSPAPASQSGGQSSSQPAPPLFGKDLPFFSPATEIMEWDGKHWNINNQRLFQARFEKYLNATEETTDDDKRYQQIIHDILQKLAPADMNVSGSFATSNGMLDKKLDGTYEQKVAPAKLTAQGVADAWRLLPQASAYPIDANLCDALSVTVYGVWQSQHAQYQLAQATEELKRQREQQHARLQATAADIAHITPAPSRSGAPGNAPQAAQSVANDARLAPHVEGLAETEARILATNVKRELSELQARVEFQALIMQFFLQRRFQHVLMATRFYRQLFGDATTNLALNKDTEELFSRGTGMPPTVGTLDSVANEAIRDVREGVDAYKFLLEKGELESATKRLAEAFLIGEYMPEIRTLPREEKRRALVFTQKSNRLISALDVRDYALAENIVKELEALAKDFDSAPARAAIETAQTISAMHLAKAKNAAISGDTATLETEIREATTIWPRNPALAEVSKLIFSQAGTQQKAIADLEQLLSQHNYRQIFDDKMRFIAATAINPERQEQLKTVLDKMQLIETTIARCNEIAKLGDHCGAWEAAERMYKQFPEDTKLNELRANLTTEAADFVHSIRTAQQLEQNDQIGSSLAWYLKAQKIYPPSEIAQEGVSRLVPKILPNS